MDRIDAALLPPTIRSRFVEGINGLRMHVLEAGFETKGRPCVLLLHGFPELAYSWRKVMPALAAAGYHVIAPDQRGYGRTTGWDADYGGDLNSFRLLNLVRDALGLVSAFGYASVAVAGHDFGSPVAAWCALVRPDVFRRGVTLDGGNGLQLRALSEHMGRARLSRGLPRKIRRSAGGLRLCLREHTATS